MSRPDVLAATRLQLLTRDRDHRLEIELHGDLNVTTAPRLLALLDAGLANPAIHRVEIKANHLRSVDHGGLSMLMDAGRRTASSGRSFMVGDPPTSLLRLARLSGTEDLLVPEPAPSDSKAPEGTISADRPRPAEREA